RRRHTRFSRDWSSDVCSSDLVLGTKAEGIPGMPAAQRGRYVRQEFSRDIEALFNQIRSINPNIIIALGATPSWALLHQSGIKARSEERRVGKERRNSGSW